MSVSDNFDRADAGTLGANWTQLEGQIGIVSNWAGGTSTPGNYQWAIWTANSFNATQSSEVVIDRLSGCGVMVRAQSGIHGYFLLCNGGPLLLYRRDSGSYTLLQDLSSTAVNGDTVKLEISGTTLKAYKNGVQIGSDQDATASGGAITGGSPGIATNDDGGGGGGLLDDWVGTGEVSADTVSISTPVSYQTFSRSGTTGSIAITGTYTGTPTAIEADFNGGGYSTIDASPAGGTYSGTLSSQTNGRGTLTVRFTNDTAVNDTVGPILISDVFGWGGDSRAEGRLTNLQAGDSHEYTEGDVWAGGDPADTGASTGTLCPLIAELFEAKFGFPCAFVTAGAGSTDVAGTANQWAKNNSAYANLVTQVTASGVSSIKGVLMLLGPNAIVNGSTLSKATYNAALDQMASDFAADLAGAPKTLVDVCGEVGTGSPPDRRAAEDNIRQAVIEAWGNNSNLPGGPVLIDQDYADDVHFASDAQALVVAKRYWAAIENAFYSGTYGRGPRIASLSSVSGTATLLTFDRDLDGAIGTTYGGFRVKSDGTSVTVTSATKTGAREIVVVHNPATVPRTVSFGSNDDAVGQTVPAATVTLPDASTVALPAEPFIDAPVGSAKLYTKSYRPRPFCPAREKAIQGAIN